MSSVTLDFNKDNGLVFCQNINEAKNNTEILYLSEIQKLNASAVFFRRFYKNESSKPYHSEPSVCIFDKENDFFNSPEHKALHAALWSAGKNEVYIIQSKTRIDIINARRPAEVINKELNLENLRLASSAINEFNDQRFSAYLFGSGSFWEQTEFGNELSEKFSPYIYLLNHLMAARKIVLDSKKDDLSPSTIDKLLIVCILIKFLEEIKDDNGKNTLKNIYHTNKIKTFTEALKNGIALTILDALAVEFNGRIFNRFSEEEKESIKKADLSSIAQFLQADINPDTKQFFLWQQYDFKYLPSEVISAIYENFIQAEALRLDGKTEKGIVYTPIHLVNLLIDEVMPLEDYEKFKKQSFRILDPACGSGVFLVAAYKRLLQWWAINNSTKDNIQYPQSAVALQILEDNIFGVDINETATLVTVFGLTTALLDKLTPQQIWNNLKFKDLSKKNIHANDKGFFDWALNSKELKGTFDLVIGNPPFNPLKEISKKDAVSAEELALFRLKSTDIPNNNFAIKFLEGAFFFGKTISMIIPSNVLLYNKDSQKYRNRIFTEYSVKKIYDFTHLRNDLFHKTANTPVVALVIENKPSKQKPIEHIVVKRTLSTEKKIRFEIDHYDTHQVRWNWAVDDNKSFIWKTNLLGGGRLFHFIYRLSLLQNFGTVIDELHNLDNEWTFSVGYKLNGDSPKKNIEYIYNKESINTKSFDESENFDTFIEQNKDFQEPRDARIYQPPHLIIKENIGKKSIPIHYSEKYLCFKDKLIGLHAPKNQKELLISFYEKFRNSEYSKISRFFILSTSAESMINRESTCKKEDIESLPFPEEIEYLKLSDSEKIIQDDVLNYYIHLGKSIGDNGAGNVFYQKVELEQLKVFGNTFCQTLNTIYAQENKKWQLGKVYQTDLFTACQFGFGTNEGLKYEYLENLDEIIKPLIENEIANKGAIYKRVLRIYEPINGYDCVFLIKPHAQRYWFNSIALRDADETFLDLKNAGF